MFVLDFLVVLFLWIFFVIHVYLCYTVLSVSCSFVINCWERADLLALLCVVLTCVFVTFSYCVQGQVWYMNLIVYIPKLCNPLYFLICAISLS